MHGCSPTVGLQVVCNCAIACAYITAYHIAYTQYCILQYAVADARATRIYLVGRAPAWQAHNGLGCFGGHWQWHGATVQMNHWFNPSHVGVLDHAHYDSIIVCHVTYYNMLRAVPLLIILRTCIITVQHLYHRSPHACMHDTSNRGRLPLL